MDGMSRVCPRYHHAIELIGRRWTGAIIVLLLGGRTRFHELAESIPEMSDRMLSERLKELEAEGIVRRLVRADTPVRVEYQLTPKGRSLEEAVRAISNWAETWLPDPVAAPDRAAAGKAERTSADQVANAPADTHPPPAHSGVSVDPSPDREA